MTRPLYSVLLLEGTGAGSANVPAGDVWVVRDVSGIIKAAPGSSPGAIHFSVNGTRFWEALVVPFREIPFHWSGRQVLAGGQTLDVNLFGGPVVSYAISGYQLTTP